MPHSVLNVRIMVSVNKKKKKKNKESGKCLQVTVRRALMAPPASGVCTLISDLTW